MTAVSAVGRDLRQGPTRRGPAAPARLLERLGPAWPLKVLLLGVPLWWALGVMSIVFIAAAAVMGLQMLRRGRIRLPVGFGLWGLFLLWMLLGASMLWVDAPGTVPGGGPGRLVGFTWRAMWYLAVTIALLYPLSLGSKALPTRDVVRWLAWLFVVVVAFGAVGVVFPRLEFTSPLEAVIPGLGDSGFVYTLVHPALTTSSDFLGYDQPRPRAPFAYANSWGNNVGLLLPFFVAAVASSRRTLVRVGGVLVLLVAIPPVVYSLNRGLWVGLCLAALYGAALLVRARAFVAVYAAAAATVVLVVALLLSPVAATVAVRLETPHSNERRTAVAEVVTSTTMAGSPLLGFGTTRTVQGNFASIAGGQTPDCRQCAAPPLGTQGFLWRLIFTTGFVGTALFAAFMIRQLARHLRSRAPAAVLGCMTIVLSAFFFTVYDSLESPIFFLMLAIGLMNREALELRRAEVAA